MPNTPATVTAKQFITLLKSHSSPEEREKNLRYFKNTDGDQFIGVRMGRVFASAKEFIDMTPSEIEKLLDSKIHEVRAGGCSIMDKQARRKKTTPERRKELYDLYLRRHDRINNWDLVDVCSIYVIGGYLCDKPRTVLYKLARSKNMWERRTALRHRKARQQTTGSLSEFEKARYYIEPLKRAYDGNND